MAEGKTDGFVAVVVVVVAAAAAAVGAAAAVVAVATGAAAVVVGTTLKNRSGWGFRWVENWPITSATRVSYHTSVHVKKEKESRRRNTGGGNTGHG